MMTLQDHKNMWQWIIDTEPSCEYVMNFKIHACEALGFGDIINHCVLCQMAAEKRGGIGMCLECPLFKETGVNCNHRRSYYNRAYKYFSQMHEGKEGAREKFLYYAYKIRDVADVGEE